MARRVTVGKEFLTEFHKLKHIMSFPITHHSQPDQTPVMDSLEGIINTSFKMQAMKCVIRQSWFYMPME